jgi:hypothetical protein
MNDLTIKISNRSLSIAFLTNLIRLLKFYINAVKDLCPGICNIEIEWVLKDTKKNRKKYKNFRESTYNLGKCVLSTGQLRRLSLETKYIERDP